MLRPLEQFEKRLSFRYAELSDDERIRQLLSSMVLPGDVAITIEREPNYFFGPEQLDTFHTILGEYSRNEPIEGSLTRWVREGYINGLPSKYGYIGNLRVRSGGKSLSVLLGLCESLRTLIESEPKLIHIAAISQNNPGALGLLVQKPLKHFPKLVPIERLVTLTLRVRGNPKLDSESISGEEITEANAKYGPERQFSSVLTAEKIDKLGLCNPKHKFVAVRSQNKIVAQAVCWDSSSYKQIIVKRYPKYLTLLRPLINVYERLLTGPQLPALEEEFNTSYVAFLTTQDNSPKYFEVLLEKLCAAAVNQGNRFLTLTFSEKDPLRRVAQRTSHTLYSSTLFRVEFEASSISLGNKLCTLDTPFL